MSNHSVIEHRANYHFIKVEEDYVHICSKSEDSQYPQCKAVILSILEHWINDKRSKGLDEYVYMTYPEWIDNMYGLFRRSTIIACLTDLEHEQLISRRAVKRHGKITYEYTLNIQVVQERLKQLPERNDKYCRPNLNASKFKRVQKQTDVNSDGSTDTNLDGSEHEDASKSKRNIDTITYTPSNIDSDMSLSGESDAPAATIHDLQKWKEESGKHKAVTLSDSQADIGNFEGVDEEDFEGETQKMPAMPKQQKPDAGTRSSVVNPPVGGQDDSASVQASLPGSGVGATPARRSGPAVDSPANSTGAAQGGKRKGKKVTQVKPTIVLTAQEQAFWDLWCAVWFNLDIPPALNETAYGHVVKLAPFITTSELLNSLIDYTRKDLAASQNIKRKMVQLGNMVFCYAGWKQAQQPRRDDTTSSVPNFDDYVGNGAEERAARRLLFQEMKARGELIS